jgi:hypothetical protein
MSPRESGPARTCDPRGGAKLPFPPGRPRRPAPKSAERHRSLAAPHRSSRRQALATAESEQGACQPAAVWRRRAGAGRPNLAPGSSSAPGSGSLWPLGCRPAGRQLPGSTFLTGPRSREPPFLPGPLPSLSSSRVRSDTTRWRQLEHVCSRNSSVLPPPPALPCAPAPRSTAWLRRTF